MTPARRIPEERAEERALVVAYLRRSAARYKEKGHHVAAALVVREAIAVERGDHRCLVLTVYPADRAKGRGKP